MDLLLAHMVTSCSIAFILSKTSSELGYLCGSWASVVYTKLDIGRQSQQALGVHVGRPRGTRVTQLRLPTMGVSWSVYLLRGVIPGLRIDMACDLGIAVAKLRTKPMPARAATRGRTADLTSLA